MADYDVEVLSLQVPARTSALTAYRPAVLIRNNGKYDAHASGYVRVYSAGRQIFLAEVYSSAIHAGDTGLATAIEYWTPPAVGDYLVNGYVTCPLDQVERNNNLAPTTITITGEPVPPPPAVLPHAPQHEDGGTDELIIDGLHGTTADPQVPTTHKASHTAGGTDELDVSGLRGILGEGQPIADHHETHEDGGGDELNVDNLRGELYNKQKPKTHANEAHDPNYSAKPHGNADHSTAYASLTDLSTHEAKTDVHGTAPGFVESTNHKGAANGYCPLGADSLVPAENLPATSILEATASEVVVAQPTRTDILIYSGTAIPDGSIIRFNACADVVNNTLVASTLDIFIGVKGAGPTYQDAVTASLQIPGNLPAPGARVRLEGVIQLLSGNGTPNAILQDDLTTPGLAVRSQFPTTVARNLTGATHVDIACHVGGGGSSIFATFKGASIVVIPA
jgi:hypothetical protein